MKETFNELKALMYKKETYEDNIKNLINNKGRLNSIELFKGIYKIYFEDDLIPTLVNYYQSKVYELDKEIEKYSIFKKI